MPLLATEEWSSHRYTPGESAERSWIVTGAQHADQALAAPNIPTVNTTYTRDGRLKAKQPNVEQLGPGGVWRVSVSYNRPEGGENPDNSGNPLDQRAVISWSRAVTQEPVDHDVWMNPIVNSAGSPFNPPPTVSIQSRMVTVTRWESIYDSEMANNFENCINGTNFRLLGRDLRAGQCMLHSYLPTSPSPVGTTPVQVAYEIEIRSGPTTTDAEGIDSHFKARLLDQGQKGFYEPAFGGEDAGGGGVKSGNIADAFGEPIGTDMLLDGEGRPMREDLTISGYVPAANPTPINQWKVVVDKAEHAVFLHYLLNQTLDFAALNLPREA